MFQDFSSFAETQFSRNLFSICVRLPESDTVLLGHVPALWQKLRVGDGLLALRAPLLDELLRRQLRLRELLRLLPGLALLVGDNLKVAKVKTWSISWRLPACLW